MTEVVYCLPANDASRLAVIVDRWTRRGYRVAAVVDDASLVAEPGVVLMLDEYPGYYVAMNELARLVLAVAGEDIIIVAGGDDIFPPEQPVRELARQFKTYFPDGYGVMQPTGDRFGEIDSVCPSPWLGAAFCRESYCGSGPYWPGYGHYWGDRELHQIAFMEGVLWKRPDVGQYHDHWSRHPDKHAHRRPHHKRNFDRWFLADRALFESRQNFGFPDHYRLPLENRLDRLACQLSA